MASPQTITLYGLKTCDSCRKAKRWLKEHGLDFNSHDVRDDGLTPELLRAWASAAGWERLLNKSSKTWRSLPDTEKVEVDEKRTVALLLKHPTLLKRPVLTSNKTVLVGYAEAAYGELLTPN